MRSLADGIVMPHRYDAKAVSDGTRTDPGPAGFAQQQYKDEVDVNVIMRRFSGSPPVPRAGAVYGDFTGIEDFESARALVRATEERFKALPAEVRDHFKNDPGELVRVSQTLTEPEFQEILKPWLRVDAADAGDEPPGGSAT